VEALGGISFTIRAGEVVGFLGPNGAGKTTTLRILAGIFPPSSGSVRIAGRDPFVEPLACRRAVGYFPEYAPFYPELRVAQYLGFVAELKRIPRGERRAEVARVLAACGLEAVAGRRVGTLSKGYRQRVGLAQALCGDPPILILDEPTIGLDPVQIIETRNLIRDLAGNHTVILSTHILPEVSATCQRVLIINDGEIAAEDTPDNLTRRLRGAETLQVEVRGPREAVVDQLRGLPHVMDVTVGGGADGTNTYTVACALGHDLREQLAATIVGQGWGLLELRPVRLSLEEIFLEIITEEHDLAEELVEA
jgi:ABC-2 type transport system ATP-binding protein